MKGRWDESVGSHTHEAVTEPQPPKLLVIKGPSIEKCNAATHYYQTCQEVQSLNEGVMQCTCLLWLGLEEEEFNKEDEEGQAWSIKADCLGSVFILGSAALGGEVITVSNFTGSVASYWHLVIISAAGNNKKVQLCNNWLA